MPPDAATVAAWALGLEGRDPETCRVALARWGSTIRAHAADLSRPPGVAEPLELVGWLAGLDALTLQDTDHDTFFELVDVALPALSGRPTLAGWLHMRRARQAFLKGYYGRARADAAAAVERLAGVPDPAAPRLEADIWPPIASDVRDEARLIAAAADRNSGAVDQALAVATAVARDADRRGARLIGLKARFQVACALQTAERHDDAVEVYRGLFGELTALGVERLRGLVLANLGLGARDGGRLDEARAFGAEAVAVFDAHGDRLMSAKVSALLGLESFDDRVSMARAVGCEESRLALELERADDLARRGQAVRARIVCEQIAWAAEALQLGWVSDAACARRQALALPDALQVDPLGFTPPGGDRVDLSRRVAPRFILWRLVEARLAEEGPVGAEALIAVGWPGERMRTDSGLARVYTAIRTLRRAGLADRLQRTPDGYALVGPLRQTTGPGGPDA